MKQMKMDNMSRKKIGIITFYKAINYGAVLQAYALMHYLNKYETDVEIVDYDSHLYEHYQVNKVKNYMLQLFQSVYRIKLHRKYKNFSKFRANYLQISEEKYDQENIELLSRKGYDAIITGSDQVWNPNLINGDKGFLLDFNCGKCKKYSYAASIGVDSVSSDVSRYYGHVISEYSAISVREKSAADILKQCGIDKSFLVADPTLLLSVGEWEKIEKKVTLPYRYVLIISFGTDIEMWKCAQKYAKDFKCKVCTLDDSIIPLRGVKKIGGLGPAEWLYVIHHAECVFTNSFHGLMFSIIYKKNFWVSDPKDGTNSRIAEILELIGCEDRQIECFSETDITKMVDFFDVDYKLQDLILDSRKYIESIIEGQDSDDITSIVPFCNEDKLQLKHIGYSLECMGCTACMQICPRSAVKMQYDAKGCEYPRVEESICINCGACIRICPIGEEKKKLDVFTQRYYAFKSRNKDDIRNCSSGGVFLLLAREIINGGGVVYGVIYNTPYHVSYGRAQNEDELWRLSGTKYVESTKGDVLQNVMDDLNSGKKVLFTGTPCTVAGLKATAGNKFGSRLITMDLICHGVPSPVIYREYLKFMEKKYRSKVKKINFRDKVYDERLSTYTQKQKIRIDFENGKVYHGTSDEDVYYRLFWSNNMLRESCYGCQYANMSRVSDITIGDYWGNQKKNKDFFKENTESSVIINTKVGKDLFDIIREYAEVIEVSKNDIMQRNLSMPTPKSLKYNSFWTDYVTHSFKYILIRYADYFGILKLVRKVFKK